jgi:hypothetical protein
MGTVCSTDQTEEDAYKILLGKPAGKTPLGRPRSMYVDNITMDLREIGLGAMDCIDLDQDRDLCRNLVNMEMNLGVT